MQGGTPLQKLEEGRWGDNRDSEICGGGDGVGDALNHASGDWSSAREREEIREKLSPKPFRIQAISRRTITKEQNKRVIERLTSALLATTTIRAGNSCWERPRGTIEGRGGLATAGRKFDRLIAGMLGGGSKKDWHYLWHYIIQIGDLPLQEN